MSAPFEVTTNLPALSDDHDDNPLEVHDKEILCQLRPRGTSDSQQPAADSDADYEATPPPGCNIPAVDTTSPDQRVPIELVEEILNYLDLFSVVKCRSVCSAFRNLIDSSPDFGWKMELALAGKEDGGSYPLATRREMLERHQKGWEDLQWTSEQRWQMSPIGIWELCGSILAQTDEQQLTIRFKQMPSLSRNIPERDWNVDITGFQLQDFTMDQAQDLLIIVEQPHWREDVHTCRIFLLTLSTGDSHPLAGSHIIEHTSEQEQRIRSQWPTKMCGYIICVLFDNHDLYETEIMIWNWKTGEVVANIISNHVSGMAFLSERYIMFAIRRELNEPLLVVVDLNAQSPEPRRLNDARNVFTFHFPPFSAGAFIADFNVCSDPAPSNWKHQSKRPVPFFTSWRSCLYIINILTPVWPEEKEVQLYALGDSFLSLIEQLGQNTTDFNWHMWGPGGTRMVVSRTPHSRIWTRFVYGTRHVWTRRPQGDQADYIYIDDFNQSALRWSTKGAKSDTAAESVVDMEDSEWPLSYVNVTAPTKIVDSDIFQGGFEVETRLGYRVKRWAIPNHPEAVGAAMICEDGIAIAYGQHSIEEFHILTV